MLPAVSHRLGHHEHSSLEGRTPQRLREGGARTAELGGNRGERRRDIEKTVRGLDHLQELQGQSSGGVFPVSRLRSGWVLGESFDSFDSWTATMGDAGLALIIQVKMTPIQQMKYLGVRKG